MPLAASYIWRNYVSDGIPGSGYHDPVKSEIREWATWIESGAYLGIWRDETTGYLRLVWDGSTSLSYSNYPLDYNITSTDVAAAGALHNFHMYAAIAADALTSLGQLTGYYGHLDGDPDTILSGITVSDMSTHRGNLTWGPDGTLTSGRAGQFTTRLFDTTGTPGLDGNGIMTYGYGIYSLACTDTAGTGVMQNAYGAWLEAANYDSGTAMTTAVALYLMTRNLADGGGINYGYGVRIDYASAGTGITNYYGVYSSIADASSVWGLYFSGTVKHYIAGWVGLGTQTEVAKLYIYETDTSHNGLRINHAATSGFTGDVLRIISGMASGTGFDLISAEASGGSDPKFRVRGDGNATCDGSFTGGGADYAIWREWSDGNAANENRVGQAVVWDGRKVRLARASDKPEQIRGVVTRNATIIENGDNNKWKGKYLRDAFGAVLQEIYQTIEVECFTGVGISEPTDLVRYEKGWRKMRRNERRAADNDNYRTEPGTEFDVWAKTFIDADLVPEEGGEFTIGEARYRTVARAKKGTAIREKLNPAYDPDRPYDPREGRQEWETIGVMGELRLLKGQPANPAWDYLGEETGEFVGPDGKSAPVTVEFYWSGPGQATSLKKAA